MSAARRGSLTAATWLIGLGVVFLVQMAAGWSWGAAWPLFVILVGVASLVSALLEGIGSVAGLWRLTWPVAWIVIGALSETGVLLPRAAGRTRVRVESGAASLVFQVPDGVGARIRSRMALGRTEIDPSRFPRVGDAFEFADYDRAVHRVEIDAQGGVGSLRVIGGG